MLQLRGISEYDGSEDTRKGRKHGNVYLIIMSTLYSAVGGHIQDCTASIAAEESSRGILQRVSVWVGE